jgi:hypothetical protein
VTYRAGLLLCTVAVVACGEPAWDGRYEGEFEGTYQATRAAADGRAALVRHTFAGTAWVEIRADGDELVVHATDCDMRWRAEGAEAVPLGDHAGAACRLDVGGPVGVVHVRPTSGRAHLDADRLSLEYSATGPSPGSAQVATLGFQFDGKRAR